MLDVDLLLAQQWSRVGRSGDERILACPYCPDFKSPKLWLNVRKRVFICYRCETRGTLFRLVRDHLRISDEATFKILGGSAYDAPVAFDADALTTMLRPPRPRAPRQTSLPDEYRPLPGESVVAGRVWDYLVGERGVTREQIAMHRIGYCAAGRYAGCAIVPVIQDGAVVNFVARSVLRPGKRYLNAPAGSTALDSSECVFNYDIMMMYDEITLVEGIFDALAEGEAAGSLLGKRASPSQLALLARGRRKRVRLKLDEDVAEASALGVARQLVDVGFADVTVVRPHGDPGERRGVAATIPYSLTAEVRSRLTGLPGGA